MQPKRDKFAGLSRRAKRRKLALEEDAAETGAIKAAVRSAKKAGRPAKIGMPEPRAPQKSKLKKKEGSRKKTKMTGGKSIFGQDMGDKKKAKMTEGARAQKGDRIKGLGNKNKPPKGSMGKKRR